MFFHGFLSFDRRIQLTSSFYHDFLTIIKYIIWCIMMGIKDFWQIMRRLEF